MKLTFNRNELLSAVLKVIGAIERKTSLEILSHFHLKCDGQELRITGTDLETTLTSIMPYSSEAFELCIPARKFTDVLKAFPDDGIIGMQWGEGKDEKLIVKCGKSRFTFNLLDPQDYPAFNEDVCEDAMTLSQAQLKSMIMACEHAMAKQDVRYYLNGMTFEMKGHHFHVVTTDGHRLAVNHHELDQDLPEREVIVPLKAVGELKKLLSDGDCTIRLGKNRLHVTVDGLRFDSKLIDGKFPDWRRVMPNSLPNVVQVGREDLLRAVNRVALVLTDKTTGIALTLADDRLKLSAKSRDEDGEDEIEVEYSGTPIEIGFNAQYIKDVCMAMSGDTIKLQLLDSTCSMKIEGVDTSEGEFVIMPMRL